MWSTSQPAPAGSFPSPVVESIAPASAIVFSPAPVIESTAPRPAVVSSPAPGEELFLTCASCVLLRQSQSWSISHPCQLHFRRDSTASSSRNWMTDGRREEWAPFSLCEPLRVPSTSSFGSTIICGRTTGSVESCFVLFVVVGHGSGQTPRGAARVAGAGSQVSRGCADGPCSAAPHDVSLILYPWWAWFLPPVAYGTGFGFQANFADEFVLWSASLSV